MAAIVARRGIESIVATAGSVLFMKINVVHASSINMSPMRRLTLYLNVCPVDNHPDPNVRPKYVDILSALSLSVLWYCTKRSV